MEFMLSLSAVLLTVTLAPAYGKLVQYLGGEWHLQDASLKYNGLRATVPGGIYTDLMENKIIGDILYGYNDIDTKWVPRMNWTYYRDFSVTSDLAHKINTNIVFDGLDTIATVYVNDVLVGKSDNMFVQYIFDVTKVLKVGNNRIEVRFESPINVANLEAEKQRKFYDIPQDCPPSMYHGECHVNMIRKMQASFSWDWGPSFPSVGIWKDVYIEGFDESVIRYVTVGITESESLWNLHVDTYLANPCGKSVAGTLLFNLDTIFANFSYALKFDQDTNDRGELVVTYDIPVSKSWVNPWWPNGYGSQDLYLLTVTFVDTKEIKSDFKTVRVGFRTVELVEDTLDSGLSFYFKVNHIPIFVKGSNEIPLDILPEKGQNRRLVKKLLQTARDSHMNMLRVWGGGVYESDYFYDVADELGILIWQDFMFACSLYPSTDEFLSNVRSEVRHQVKRLVSHPSIIVFSGNNENEGALANNWYNTARNFSLYKADYVKLYVDTIKKEFLELTHNRSLYITSSPTNGKESIEEGYVAKSPSSEFYGDVHYYNYILDPFNPNLYPIPRFSSEYGYQALPSIASLKLATTSIADLDYNGKFLDSRQHHPVGNAEMILLMNYQFNLPRGNNTVKNLEAIVYYSQICQAMSTKVQTERYRSYRNRVDKLGKGYTMGALYWQLNDVWIAPTWSGIDYTGKWKMLQYYVQDFFAPIIVTGYVNLIGQLELYAVSDLLSPLFNVTFTLQVYKWTSFEVISNETILIDLEPNSVKFINSVFVDSYLMQNNCGSMSDAKQNCFFYFTLQKAEAKIAPENFVVPVSFKSANLQEANVQISSVSKIGHDGVYNLEVTTDHIAAFVWLDSHNIPGKFSENGFLQVTKSRQLFFFSEGDISEDDLRQQLTVTNLKDKQYMD